ncbi:MAG: type II toxin-antitoxin system RelE/ParE family toxin [Halothiobacillaceae bacterium]
MTLVWSLAAQQQRFEQLDYIAQKHPLAAIRLDEEIEKQVDYLLAQPQMGRPGRISTTRELVIQRTPFILVYRINQERIEILRLLHGAQIWPPSA